VEKYSRAGEATDDHVLWRMRMACLINKATNGHSECVIIIPLPHQTWLQEHVSMLSYTYIACLFSTFELLNWS
jgi:hypothetical protein